jgi:mono/diheme cytochrome c family protein
MRKTLLIGSLLFLSTSVIAQVDYATEIEPIMANNCNSCHSGGASGFDSTPYADLIASISPVNSYNKKHIIPGDADGSPLVDKIEANPQVGSRMPQGGQLTSDQINKIRQWINEGANEQVQTSSEDITESPNEFRVIGNYPNPFNPTTVIQFELLSSADFQIAIYNANGQFVQSVNGRATAGIKEQSIDLTNQSSGVYYYRIRTMVNGSSGLIGSGKMTLIK